MNEKATIYVSLSDARAMFGRLCDAAVAGHRVIITRQGFTYVEIAPLREHDVAPPSNAAEVLDTVAAVK